MLNTGNPYDSLAQKSLISMSIENGQSVQEMLESNSQLQSLIFEEKKLIKQVWTKDDVSPASFLYSYKESNIVFEWNPISMTRLYDGGE